MHIYTIIYEACLCITVLVLVVTASKKFQNTDNYFWSIAILVCAVNLGAIIKSSAVSSDAAIWGNRLSYLDSFLLPAIVLMATAKRIKLDLPRWVVGLTYGIAILLTGLAWTPGLTGWYYKTWYIRITSRGTLLISEPGPFKIAHTIFLAIFFLLMGAMIYHGVTHRKNVSIRPFIDYGLIGGAAIVVYILGKVFSLELDILPIVFSIGAIVIAFAYYRDANYEIDSIVKNMHETSTTMGYVALDIHKRYLGGNDAAYAVLPELAEINRDSMIPQENRFLWELFDKWINDFEDGDRESRTIERGDRVYKIGLSYFYGYKGGRTQGYLFSIEDDTDTQKYLSFVKTYNETLHKEVQGQIATISKMQDKVVLGLANMIENRDQNTGGHVKRTSDVVKILVNIMLEHRIGNLDRVFADDIVRAAPMHDLGKIAIDNSILCKPGRLTEEEYLMMKMHSTKSGEIVLTILEGVEEQHFVDVAFNVARHHHERYDGRGYPDRLMGAEIPLEARVMAIADVYDALVSKRCYKEPMSFPEAYRVMEENMGTQFDPDLRIVFELARQQLEAYYSDDSSACAH